MALADAAIALGADVTVITIDHGINPASGQVAAEVSAWARGLGARAVVGKVTVGKRASVEAAAREVRYAALDAIAHEHRLGRVLLGHTARDQAETVLLRILRGTGPAGLAGIPATRGIYMRPLLELPRAAIDAYVAERKLPTWDDPMNHDERVARVRVREKLLPLLRGENPSLDDSLIRLAASAREWTEVIDSAAAPFASLPIDCAALAKQPAAIRKRALSMALPNLEAVHLEQLDVLVMAPARGEVALDLPGFRVVRAYDRLDVSVSVSGSPGSLTPTLALTPTLPGCELRVWKPGDRMKPARLKGGSRKLSDLFIDAKVPRELRRTARVLVRLNDQVIVWAEHLGYAFGEPEKF